MTTVICSAVVSLLLGFGLGLYAFHLGIGLSLLLSFGIFLLCHILFILFFSLIARSVPTDRPLEKQNELCRIGTAEGFSIINFYAGIRPVVTGLEKIPRDTRFLYVCNHRSIFDPLIVADKLRDYNISFISKPSNMNLPLVSRVAYAAGYLPIDRENDRNALKTILTAADYLKRDICSIGIYPEGTRSKTKDLLPFHAGSLKIAQRAKAPIVVAAVHGTEKVTHMKLFSFEKVWLDILEVIPPETVCSMRTDALAEHIRGIIQADLDRVEKQEA